jgi:hypothetical protein
MSRKIAVISIVIIVCVTLTYIIRLATATLPEVEVTSTDGRIEILFHSINFSQSLAFYPHTPETVGYIFAWVDITIKNVGQANIHINWNYAYLKDSNNYLYQGTYADSPRQFQLIDLPPGETIRGEFYFEVPAGATIEKFVWSDLSSYVSVAVPEFSSMIVLTLFMAATVLAVVVYRRKQPARRFFQKL